MKYKTKEEIIIELIREEFKDNPDCIESIEDLYRSNKNEDDSLERNTCFQIPRKARLPDKAHLQCFTDDPGSLKQAQWGAFKLYNIANTLRGEQQIYDTNGQKWLSTTANQLCEPTRDDHVNPLSKESQEKLKKFQDEK